MQQVFDKSDLIKAYIEATRDDWHPDFTNYHQKRFVALQKAFAIEMTNQGVLTFDETIYLLLFRNTINSYIRLSTGDGVLEGGLLEVKLMALQARGESINQKREQLWQLQKQSLQVHFDLLLELFPLIWGELETSVTLDDLRALGFDLLEPHISDDWDEI
jgi:hypothetical protein